MGKLPVISGLKLIKIFEKLGWIVMHKRGSHIIMIKQGEIVTLSIPDHNEVAKGTLRSLLRSAGVTIDEFNKSL